MHEQKTRLRRTRSVHPVINTPFKWVKLLQNNNPSRKANQNEKTNPIHHSTHNRHPDRRDAEQSGACRSGGTCFSASPKAIPYNNTLRGPILRNEKTTPISHTPSPPSSIPIAPHPTPKTQRLFEKTNPISTHNNPSNPYLHYL